MKRSPLSRRTPLRAAQIRAVRDGDDLEAPKKPAQRDTGPSKAVRRQVEARDGSCARCDLPGLRVWPAHQVHHRRPRGMGGSQRDNTNSPANLLWLCAVCHAWIERHREQALADGYLIGQHYTDPSAIPVLWHGRYVYLGHDGTVHTAQTTGETA